jgi:hypothetical protein
LQWKKAVVDLKKKKNNNETTAFKCKVFDYNYAYYTETWLNSNFLDCELGLDYYNIYRFDRCFETIVFLEVVFLLAFVKVLLFV